MASGPPQGEAANYFQMSDTPRQGWNNNGLSGGSARPQKQEPSAGQPTFNQAFAIQNPKWNDLWAGILFLAVVAGFAVVSALSIKGYASTRNFNPAGIENNTNSFGLTTHTIILFTWVLVAAAVLSYVYVLLARAFTKQFIWMTGILNIMFSIATAVYMIIRKNYAGGIIFLIFSVLIIIAFISWISRIPFSVLMLQTAIDISKNHGHVYLVSAVGGLLGAAFAAWFAVTLVTVYIQYYPSTSNPNCANGGCSNAKVIGLLVFVTFAAYWISEWLQNTIHTTISGVYGSWYFNSRNYPTNVTRGALRRSLTYSFGSISFGSLIVAIIQFLRQICTLAQQQEAMQGNYIGAILFCVMGCLISILDWAVQFINRYAFSHIALYGKPYLQAAKDTWRMIRDRGIDALVNECLVGPVLATGGLCVAYACGFIAYLYLVLTRPAYNADGGYTPVILSFSFLIGLQICNVFTTPLSSGIDTIFVAMAWDPEVMMRDHPDLYARMVGVYPHIQMAIHA